MSVILLGRTEQEFFQCELLNNKKLKEERQYLFCNSYLVQIVVLILILLCLILYDTFVVLRKGRMLVRILMGLSVSDALIKCCCRSFFFLLAMINSIVAWERWKWTWVLLTNLTFNFAFFFNLKVFLCTAETAWLGKFKYLYKNSSSDGMKLTISKMALNTYLIIILWYLLS